MSAQSEGPHPALPERLKRSPGTNVSNARIALQRNSRGATPRAPLAWADGPGCPFCRSNDTEVISLFGSQVMTMQCKCRACGSFFEAGKY